MDSSSPVVAALRTRVLAVAPVRGALALACLAGARLLGAGSTPALLAFATGAVGFTIALLGDPRQRLPAKEPAGLPEDARLDPVWRAACSSLFPSTFGLVVLALLAAARQPTLTAFLGGGILGLGVAGVLSLPGLMEREARYGGRLYVDRRTHRVFVSRRR
jgi:hypothetical protein